MNWSIVIQGNSLSLVSKVLWILGMH